MGGWHGVAGEEHWEPLRRARAAVASARLLANTLGFAMCGRKAVQKAAVAPMRTTARQLEAYIFA